MEVGRIEGIKKGLFHFLKKNLRHAFFTHCHALILFFESSMDAFNNYITYIFILILSSLLLILNTCVCMNIKP